jgi:hypothetical protein
LYQGSVEALNSAQLVIDLLGTDSGWRAAENPLRALASQAAREAKRKANQYLARNPGDLQGAVDIYEDEFKSRVDGLPPAARRRLTALGALRNLWAWGAVWDGAKGLITDIERWFDWRKEAERERGAMDEAQNSMRDVQLQIDSLRARCPDLPPGSGFPLPEADPAPCPEVPPGSAAQASAGYILAAAAPGPDRERVSAAYRELDATLARLEPRVMNEVVPPLLPFLVGETADIDPRILAGLLQSAARQVEALLPDLELAEAQAAEIQRLVEALEQPADQPQQTASVATSSPDR